MKLKKILAGVSAAALAASMSCAFSASALTLGADKIDFEDGDISFLYQNIWDGAGEAVMSVEDYEGSKQLKLDVQDCSKYVKLWIDMDKIMPRASAVNVRSIEFDITIVPKDSTKQLGWVGGEFGAAGGFDKDNIQPSQKNPGWSGTSWTCDDNDNLYADGGIAKAHVKRNLLLPTQYFNEKGTNPFFAFMIQPNQNGTDYVMYIDNMVFTGDKGAITVGLPPVEETTVEETTAAAEETTAALAEETTAAPAEETTAAPAETEAAPAETTAAPAETEAPATEAAPAETTAAAPAVDTAVPATGNTTAAAMVAVMAVAGAAAVISKKRG